MSNTTISIKKSATPSATPSNLANGELAINFADGKLFYKNATGQIVSFTSGTNSFGTVNANGTLIIADTTGDILTLEAGNNIAITADAINDKITISASVVDSSIAIAAFNQANAAFDKANNALANSTGTFSGNLTIDGTVTAVHFDNVSDITLKENVISLSNNDLLYKLNPVSFNWKNSGEKSFGLIAQEVEKIIPEIVHQKDDGTKTISYIQLISHLIFTVKDLQRQIDDINNNINNA